MVRILYVHSGTGFVLQEEGHADAAPKGEDIVCSAVSILLYTAAQRMLDLYVDEKLQQWPIVDLRSGNSRVAADARKDCVGTVRQAFETVLTGFRVLAMQYPQHVMVTESSPG